MENNKTKNFFDSGNQNGNKPFSISQPQNSNKEDNTVAATARVSFDPNAGLNTPEQPAFQDTLRAAEDKPFSVGRNDITGYMNNESHSQASPNQSAPQPVSQSSPEPVKSNSRRLFSSSELNGSSVSPLKPLDFQSERSRVTSPDVQKVNGGTQDFNQEPVIQQTIQQTEQETQKPITFTRDDNDVAKAAHVSINNADAGLREPDPALNQPTGGLSSPDIQKVDGGTQNFSQTSTIQQTEPEKPISFGRSDNDVATVAHAAIIDADAGLHEPDPALSKPVSDLSGSGVAAQYQESIIEQSSGLRTLTGEILHAPSREPAVEEVKPISFGRNEDNDVAKVAHSVYIDADAGLHEAVQNSTQSVLSAYGQMGNGTPKRDGPEKISGGNLHFDEIDNKDAVDRLNATIKGREWRNKHLRPIADALSKPIEQVASQAEGDEQTSQGIHKIKDYAGLVPSIAGGIVDDSGIDSLIQSIAKQDDLIRGGDSLEKIIDKKTKDPNGNTIFSFDYSDYVVFTKAQKHPEYTAEELRKIKEEVRNSVQDGKQLKTLSGKKQATMEKAIRMNMAETYAETMMLSNPGIFSEAEREILKQENSLFSVTNMADFKMRDDLINKVLTNSTFGGELGKVDWRRVSAKDVSDMLKGRKGFLIKDERLRGILEAKLGNIQKMNKLKEIGRRKARRKGLRGELFGRVGREVLKDEELSAATGVVGKEVAGAKLAGKVAVGAGSLGYATARTTGKVAGKTAIKAAQKAGLNTVADMIAVAGAKYTGLEKAIGNLKNTPRNAMKGTAKLAAKGTASVGRSIANTALYKNITGSRLGKALGKTGRILTARFKSLKAITKKLANIALTPVRAASAAIDYIKRKILIPIAIFLGGLFVIELVIGFFAGMQSANVGGGAVACVILDDEDHFRDFQTKYDEQDSIFQSQVNSVINSPAQTKNLRGETIGYGINTAEVKNSDGSKTLASQYQNGLHLGYFYDGNSSSGISSNIEDILSAMAVVMAQDQSNHHAEALEFIEAAYKSSHAYTTRETDLYQCSNGCTFTKYFCNDYVDDVWYQNSDLKYKPWTYGDFVKPTANQECSVCKAEGLPYNEYAGCTVTGTCYHGGRVEGEELSTDADDYSDFFEFDVRDDEKASEYYTQYVKPSIVKTYPKSCPDGYNSKGVRRYVLESEILEASGLDSSCDNYEFITLTRSEDYVNKDGHDRTHTEDCGYLAVCKGHNHYGCPDGHEVATCYGHTDLYMNVYVSSLNKLFEMGGVPINEKAGSAATEQVYGMNKEDFEKLSAEEQAKVIEEYTNKLNGGGAGDGN